MNTNDEIMHWLLEGDVSVQYQVHRDLLGNRRPNLQSRIATEGWGLAFLERQQPDGNWGRGFYQPKWISTHYTLLDLRYLELPPDNPSACNAVARILREEKGEDGGINPAGTIKQSDVCVNGMFLIYGCYFGAPAPALESVVDFVISQHMADGGFNCRLNRQGAVHSSLHSTISILEGIHEYAHRGYTYRLEELEKQAACGREFLLQHQLFRSDRTGEVINAKMLMLSYPSRWYYDILRALVYFADSDSPYDLRMQPALDVLMSKRRSDGRWPVQAKHAGQVHFDMERTGGPSRWNTLRALKVLSHFQ